MRVSTKRILSIGVAGIFLIGSLVVYSSLITGELEAVNEKQGAVNDRRESLATQQQAVTKVTDLIKQFEGVKSQDTIALAMPNGDDTVGALRGIQAIALQSGVVISALDFKTSVPRVAQAQPFIKKLSTLEVSLKLNGPYEGAERFIQLLETAVRVANVKNFKFQTSPTAGNPIGSLELVVDTYYQQ